MCTVHWDIVNTTYNEVNILLALIKEQEVREQLKLTILILLAIHCVFTLTATRQTVGLTAND